MIIITGGSGLVGKALQECECDAEVWMPLSSKDCNLLHYEDTYQTFAKLCTQYEITGIIHLAAQVGGLFKNLHTNVRMFEENMIINMNVIKAAHACGIQRMICILSTCIFPDRVSYPIREEMLHQGEPHESNCGYAYAKRMLEVQCKLYQREYNRDYICVIPTNIYGKYDNFHLEDAHVIPALIHKCYLQKMRGEPFTIMGSGKPLRQFIYSRDLARLILRIFREYHGRENLILSVGEEDEISIKDVAILIAKKMDYTLDLVVDAERQEADGQYKKSVSNAKIKELFPDFTFTPFEVGLNETIEWFIQSYPHVRK